MKEIFRSKKLSNVIMKSVMTLVMIFTFVSPTEAQQRRPIDNRHPLWFIHVDVWNNADPQKIIDLIPEDIRPYVCFNLSLSCSYDKDLKIYQKPQLAIPTYKSWASVCCANNVWFTCQPASGGHTHIMDDELDTFEYFFIRYKNFLGWNYAEQFWGFDEPNDHSSSTQASRLELFSKLVPMHHKYGGFLTISFCGNIWSHGLNPIGMMKRNNALLKACHDYPEACLWLYKYTTSSCFYNNESVTLAPFISGLATNYGVRYDNCGWNGAMDALFGEGKNPVKYPNAVGFGTVMEQTAINGGAVWDGPELIWTEDFHEINRSTVNGFQRRNWAQFNGFTNGWQDIFRKVIDGTIYIPTREEVVGRNKVVILNDINNNNYEQSYASIGDLYDGLYKQDDPMNRNNGQWMDNFCYFKKTGRYQPIPVVISLYDDIAKSIPVQVKRSAYSSRWNTQAKKVQEFNSLYPEVSKGDMFVARHKNELVTYFPFSCLAGNTQVSADIPLQYNSCDTLTLKYNKYGTGIIHEYADKIEVYLNNYRSDTTSIVYDYIIVKGVTSQPSMTYKLRADAKTTRLPRGTWDSANKEYTVTVNHMGPIEITINCSGTGTDKKSDYIEVAELEKPLAPEPYIDDIITEAEDMDFRNVNFVVTDAYNQRRDVRGQTAMGFVEMGTNTQAALRDSINVKASGKYTIAVRYTTTEEREGELTAVVNKTTYKIPITKTGYNKWRKAKFEVELPAGVTGLMLRNSGATELTIDNVTYAPCAEIRTAPVISHPITIKQTEGGTASASLAEAECDSIVTLTAEADEGYRFDGWQIILGNIVIEDNSFVMPEGSVILKPVFTNLNSVYEMTFEGVLGGNFPAGWRAVQGGSEIHQYPNNYGSGARTMTGFTGFEGAALYWRESMAEYGRQADYRLNLEPGKYKLTYNMAAWKGTPTYTAQILSSTNTVIAKSNEYVAMPNADGNTAANISSAELRELEFTISTAGNYVIRFQSTGGFSEYLLATCRITKAKVVTGINDISASSDDNGFPTNEIYTIGGIKSSTLHRGLNIIKMKDGSIRKVMIK